MQGLFTQKLDLVAQIQSDRERRKKGDEPILFTVQGQSTSELNGEFVHSQIVIDVLLRIKPTEADRDEFISRCKKTYEGNDKTQIAIFHRFVTRGTKVGIDEEFYLASCPVMPNQTSMPFQVYITTELSAQFCDEPGMKLHGTLTIDLPDVHLGLNREIEFSLIFGKMELVAKAKNLQNGRIYNTSFDLDLN